MGGLLLLFVFFISVQSKKTLNFTGFLDSTPRKYGILTYSHSEVGDFKKIKSHVDKYTSMQCSQMSQISIIQIGIQSYDLNNLTKQSNLKRPVYFVHKPYRSVDFRFYIPEESQAEVYFLINIGSEVTCDQLSDSFNQWKMKSLGDLGPIISIQGESFSFNTAKSEFQQVTNGSSKRYFNLNLLNGAWVSRFYLELYYFQICRQINLIRQIVIKQNECEDIALNFLVYSFFSEFLPELIKIDISLINNLGIDSKKSSQIRNSCFKNFVNIIGYNPMRIIDKKSSIEQPFNYQSKKYIVYAKRRELQMRMKNQSSQMFKNQKNQKTLIQKIFIDKNLSALVEQKRKKIQELKKSRDILIKARQDENQQYHKSWRAFLVFLLIYLAIMILINRKLIQKYKLLTKEKEESQVSINSNGDNELKPI